MKTRKMLLIGLPAILVVAAAFVYFNSGKQEVPVPEIRVETDTVTSDDGAARLDIPKGALPEGVSLSDISVTAIDRGGAEPDDAVAGYELKPDGLELSAPAVFTYSTYSTDLEYTLPLIIHLREGADEGEEDVMPAIKISTEIMEDTLAVSGELSDFCEVWVLKGIFESHIDSKPNHLVGENFTFVIRYSPAHEKLVFIDQKRLKHEFTLPRHEPWFIHGGQIDTEGLGFIMPPKARFRSGAYEEGIGSHVEYGYFKCEEKGTESVGSRGIDINFTVQHRFETLAGWRSHTDHATVTDSTRMDNTCSESAMVHVGQPYTIICNDGAGPFLSGWYKADPLTGELVLDPSGEPVDRETGEPVECP